MKPMDSKRNLIGTGVVADSKQERRSSARKQGDALAEAQKEGIQRKSFRELRVNAFRHVSSE